MLTRLEPVEISGQKDSFPLAAGLRLDDKRFGFPVVELLFESLNVRWQQPSFGVEGVVFGEVPLHCCQAFCQQVFPCKGVDAGKMIRPLIGVHLTQQGRHGWPIDKPYVPVFIVVNACSHAKLFSNLVDQLILRVGDVDDEGRIVVRLLLLRFRLQRS